MTGNLQLCSICGFFSEVRNNEVGLGLNLM